MRELTGSFGVHAALECVGLEQSLTDGARHHPARRRGRPRRCSAGRLDSCRGDDVLRNVTVGGGIAPARAYIEELLPDVLEGRIEPGRVFDRDAARSTT